MSAYLDLLQQMSERAKEYAAMVEAAKRLTDPIMQAKAFAQTIIAPSIQLAELAKAVQPPTFPLLSASLATETFRFEPPILDLWDETPQEEPIDTGYLDDPIPRRRIGF